MTSYSCLEQLAISYTIYQDKGPREGQAEAGRDNQGSLWGFVKFKVPVRHPVQANT